MDDMLKLEKLVEGEWVFVTETPSNDAWENAKATGERVRLIDPRTKTVILEWLPRKTKSDSR